MYTKEDLKYYSVEEAGGKTLNVIATYCDDELCYEIIGSPFLGDVDAIHENMWKSNFKEINRDDVLNRNDVLKSIREQSSRERGLNMIEIFFLKNINEGNFKYIKKVKL